MCMTSYPTLSICYGVHMPRWEPQAPEQRFWGKVLKTDGCWLWTGGTHLGYGRFRHDGKNWLAHRLAWTWEHGPLAPGQVLDHRCKTTNCVRTAHLAPMKRPEHAGTSSRFRSPPWYVRLESGRLNS